MPDDCCFTKNFTKPRVAEYFPWIKYIYLIYIYLLSLLYIRDAFNKFSYFFVQAFRIVVDSWKFTMLLLYIWLTNFYDFRFKSTATAGIGIHPTKAWLSQLVNFKNAIWTWGHFRRTICNKIVMLQTAFRPSCMNRVSVFERHKRFK